MQGGSGQQAAAVHAQHNKHSAQLITQTAPTASVAVILQARLGHGGVQQHVAVVAEHSGLWGREGERWGGYVIRLGRAGPGARKRPVKAQPEKAQQAQPALRQQTANMPCLTSGLLTLKAAEAGRSYSMPHLVTAAPACERQRRFCDIMASDRQPKRACAQLKDRATWPLTHPKLNLTPITHQPGACPPTGRRSPQKCP